MIGDQSPRRPSGSHPSHGNRHGRQRRLPPGVSAAGWEVQVSRHCILVLGMHRSGTSALTGLLGLLGAAVPGDPMPPVADNPLGYWESRRIARFNNRLLESAGTRWDDEAAVPAAWFRDPAREADREEAVRLIAEEFPGDGGFACKDPRICRLLPFWRSVLGAAGVAVHAVIMVREPLEVARSLAARAAVPAFRPAAIVARDRGLLLWLRHMIDAERHSRDLPRHAIEYRELIADWRTAVAPLVAAGLLPPPAEAVAAAGDAFLDPSLRRQRAAEAATDRRSSPPAVAALMKAFRSDHRLPAAGAAAAACDALAPALDRLVAAYAPLRAPLGPRADIDPWATAILGSLARLPLSAPPAVPRRAVFLSGAPASVGHVYRVEHPVAALRAAGWNAAWLPANDPHASARADEADLVVVFRAPWSDCLAEVAARCRRRGAPLVYDVDDLIFDPALMADGSIAVLAAMQEPDRIRFAAAADGHRTTLERCDAAVLSTRPLAAAAGIHVGRTMVLANALGPALEAAAAEAFATVVPASASDGRPRLVFASGTPSHDRDFAVAAEGIARLFASRPEPVLVLVGHIDARLYPALWPFADRIESRPPVPLPRLFAELARCDVNLAPLEAGNRFCEAKSAVRCLFAAAVGRPTVASPTEPLREAIVVEETGLLAADAADWERQIERLVTDAALRLRMGNNARLHAVAEFGWDAYRERAVAVFGGLAGGGD